MHVITFFVLVDMIIFRSMHKANHITIIANSSTISKICQNWSMLKTLYVLSISIQLRKQNDLMLNSFAKAFNLLVI